jgi:2-oxoglutarate ferredoxin oxidoreductase subunit alpha
VLRSFKHVLVPEVNLGQLSLLLRAKFLIDIQGLNKVRGKPYRIIEIKQAVEALLSGKPVEEAFPADHTPSPSAGGGLA